ncbi:MAG: hypothetical protein HY913_16385 [Desulfomonile tiedjei]|nr:hypothetical protein [Desulfomonile tiedjei]
MKEGSLKYQVVVRIRSLYDGAIPDAGNNTGEPGLEQLIEEIDACSEAELNRQVYEDDTFIMCLECKEAFMKDIYSRVRPEATPENGRAHLIH